MSYGAAEVSANNTVPCPSELLIAFLLNVCGNILHSEHSQNRPRCRDDGAATFSITNLSIPSLIR